MFDFIEGKRYLGEFEIVRKCEKRRIKIDFKSLFSFEVERIENDTITVKNLNPYQINRILPYIKEIKIYIKKVSSVFVIKGSIVDSKDDSYVIKLDGESLYKEKRRFHRFSFCCEDLGKYLIKKGWKTYNRGCLYHRDKQTWIKNSDQVTQHIKKRCEICTVESLEEDVKFDINVVDIKEEYGYHIIRAEITKTNINLINFVMNGYIKVAEKLILEGQ